MSILLGGAAAAALILGRPPALAARPWADIFAARFGGPIMVARYNQTGSDALFGDYAAFWWLEPMPHAPDVRPPAEWVLDPYDEATLRRDLLSIWPDAGVGEDGTSVAIGGDLAYLVADIAPGACEYAMLSVDRRLFVSVSCT